METENKQYPFDYQELGVEETEEIKKYFAPMFTNAVRPGSKGYFFYKRFENIVLDVYNMEIRPTDTFVLSFPRSGTTWTQELVRLLQNDCDFDKAKAIVLPKRFPFIEFEVVLTMNLSEEILQQAGIQKCIADNFLCNPKAVSTLPSPRFIKSHLPFTLLPPTLLDIAKVVYVARDPRDVAVSLFFHQKTGLLVPQEREFKPFWNFFIQNKVLWSPYFEHVKEAWERRNHPNMKFIFYEELSKDLGAVTRRMATFFDKELSEEQYQKICNHLKFDNFKNNTSVNRERWRNNDVNSKNFIRKGKCGGWREHFDAEMTLQAESWIADNLRDTDLQFPQFE